jgi:hypothetical protein
LPRLSVVALLGGVLFLGGASTRLDSGIVSAWPALDAARPPQSCGLTTKSTRLRPGDVALLVVHCDAAPESVSVRLAGQSLPLFGFPESGGSDASESSLAGLVGIDVAAPTGKRTVVWKATLPGGRDEGGNLVLSVEPRDFPTQRIRVARRFDELDARTLARTEEEQRRLLEVLSGRSPERLWRGPFAAPVSGSGSGFGSRRVVNGRASSPHSGLDLEAEPGTPVLASNAGTVALADTLFFAGGTVVLDHGLGLFTIYSHLSEISVSPGQRVERGRPIARSGATGRVTGPHLHWGVRLAGARVNPLSLLAATGAPLSGSPAPLDETPPDD